MLSQGPTLINGMRVSLALAKCLYQHQARSWNEGPCMALERCWALGAHQGAGGV